MDNKVRSFWRVSSELPHRPAGSIASDGTLYLGRLSHVYGTILLRDHSQEELREKASTPALAQAHSSVEPMKSLLGVNFTKDRSSHGTTSMCHGLEGGTWKTNRDSPGVLVPWWRALCWFADKTPGLI